MKINEKLKFVSHTFTWKLCQTEKKLYSTKKGSHCHNTLSKFRFWPLFLQRSFITDAWQGPEKVFDILIANEKIYHDILFLERRFYNKKNKNETISSGLYKYYSLTALDSVNPFHVTGLFLYPPKNSFYLSIPFYTSGFLMFSGGTERDQWYILVKAYLVQGFMIFNV